MTYDHHISKNLKRIRLQRHISQADLADLLEVTQAHLSHIENRKAVLTAGQFLRILQHFNLSIDDFVPRVQIVEKDLQNVLARHGARHLFEDPAILPSQHLSRVVNAVSETLVDGHSPRLIVSLSSVIIENAEVHLMNKIRLNIHQAGLICRFGWFLDNTLEAITKIISDNALSLTDILKAKFNRTRVVIKNQLSLPVLAPPSLRQKAIDILEIEFNDEKTLSDIQRSVSALSKKWHIVSRIQPEHFEQAIRESYELI